MNWQPYPEYKDSGVEWLGQIPEHWEVWKVTHGFRQIGSGTTPKSEDRQYYDGNVPWVTTSELRETIIYETEKSVSDIALKDYSSLKTYPEGTLLIAMYGATIGRLGILGAPATMNQACCAFSSPIVFDQNYFFFWLIYRRQILISLSEGGGQPNLNQEELKALKVPIPNLEEQKHIAAFLNKETAKIDALIEKKQKQIGLLQEKRTALITRAVTKGLDPNAHMKDSGVEWLGQIPSHWKVRPLFSLMQEKKEINIGNQVQNVLSLSYGNIIRRDVSDNFGLLPESFETYQILNIGHIVLRLTDLQNDKNSLRVGLAKQHGIITSAYTCLETNHDFDSSYGYQLLHAYDLLKVFYGLGGGVRQTMRFEDLKWLPILYPPKNEQCEIVKYLDQNILKINKLADKLREGIDLLKEYRTALITAAVTGKIDLRNETAS